MASNIAALNGSGNQQIYIALSYVSYNQAGNYSTWAWELRYYGNGYGSWGTTIYWSLSGFAVGGGSHYVSQGERYNTYTVLGGGTFNKAHNAAGYLSAGTLVGSINTDHTSIGDGSVGVSSGTPPRIPKAPGKPPTPTFQSASTTFIKFGIQGPADNGGSTITTYNLQAAKNAAFTDGLVSWNSGSSNQTTPTIDPGNGYFIRYRAVNGVGAGPWSDSLSAQTLPATAPGLVMLPTLSGTGSVANVTPPSGSTGVTKYTLERRKLGTTTPVTVLESATSPITTEGLTPGDSYEYRASAWFGTYQSPWTNWVTLTQPNPNTDAGAYFDGSTQDTPVLDYAWLGAVGNSASVARGAVPDGWMTFAQGAGSSGGSGVVFQAAGGFQGSRAARVVFFGDTTSTGFFFGTAVNNTAKMAAVAGDATYVGSIYAWPSKQQRLRAIMRWYTSAGTWISDSVGDAQVVETNGFTRLVVTAQSPSNAAFAGIVVQNITGTGHSLWLSGDWLHLDAAMITLQALLPYFDGNTPDTTLYQYAWEGLENASPSSRTTLTAAQQAIDPLADPDCPPPPVAPSAPTISDDCIIDVGTWRRYWAIIPENEISDHVTMLPTIRVTTGGRDARQVRVRIYENPLNLAPEGFDDSEWISEQIVSYMPPLTTLTLDSIDRRVFAEVNGAAPIAADKLLYGSNGTPATWPTLSCGIAYLLSFDVPLEGPVGNVSIGIDLTRRVI
ncbi:minor tail protein [Microbacterium phage Dewdrop]|nr:minor tail protein [Microbacterium phage Leaf]QGZ17446.1 minor tail protein [Microbacterium phage Dewdrop]